MKVKKMIVTIVLLIVLIGGGIGLGLYINKRNDTATAVVVMDLNPSAEFVLNSGNKIISVNFLNDDAAYVFANIDVEGKTIDEVAKQFATCAIKSGYIKDFGALTSSDKDKNIITIRVSCGDDGQAQKIKNAVSEKVNLAFDENGIFGRAIVSIEEQLTNAAEKYKTMAENLHIEAKEFKDKTEAQILEIIKQQSQKISELSPAQLALLAENNWDAAMKNLKSAMEFLETQIDDLVKQLEALNIPEKIKESLTKAYNNAKIELAAKKQEFQKDYDDFVETLKVASKDFISKTKDYLNDKIAAFKTTYDAHINEFNKDKQVTIDAIQAWRKAVVEN